jgi:hypothetical protein
MTSQPDAGQIDELVDQLLGDRTDLPEEHTKGPAGRARAHPRVPEEATFDLEAFRRLEGERFNEVFTAERLEEMRLSGALRVIEAAPKPHTAAARERARFKLETAAAECTCGAVQRMADVAHTLVYEERQVGLRYVGQVLVDQSDEDDDR